MPSNPPTRRRRLINAVTSTLAKPTANYSAVSSSRDGKGSTQRSRAQTFLPLGFQPVRDASDQYQIHVTKDGSMITALPINDNDAANLRSSPILFSDARAILNESSSYSDSRNAAGKKQGMAWSKKGLLEARGKQRSKLKNRSDYNQKSSANGFANVIPFVPVANNKPSVQAVHRKNKGKRRHQVRWDLTAVNQEQSAQLPPSAQNSTGALQNIDKRDDESFSSFPILSPSHKFEDDGFGQVGRDGASAKKTAVHSHDHGPNTKQAAPLNAVNEIKSTSNVSNAAKLSPSSAANNLNNMNGEPTANFATHPQSRFATNANNPSTNVASTSASTPPFQTLLQQRIQEIQNEQSQLIQAISKKEMIERTLISAIDENLDKNRKKWKELEEELEIIKWHLTVSPKDARARMPNGNDSRHAKSPALHHRTPRQTNKTEEVESVGDPSLTMMDSTSDSLITARDTKRKIIGGAVMVTGLDPPARPSPVPQKTEAMLKKKDPDGPRISAVLRGDEARTMTHSVNVRQGPRQGVVPNRVPVGPIWPVPKQLGGSMPRNGQPQQTLRKVQHHQLPRHPMASRMQSSTAKATNKRTVKKNVHFNLPDDHESVELKFVDDSPSDDLIMSQAGEKESWQRTMHGRLRHGRGVNNAFENVKEESPPTLNGHEQIRQPMGLTPVDDQSWEGSQYDIETFDEVTGHLLSSQHFDTVHWRDREQHIVTTEHYSTENHHHAHGIQEQHPSAFNYNNQRNRGASSDSVETDADLGFIHAVAAVVIQTAVRRFLAEIAAMERLYAVQVIQTAICRWMARRTNPGLSHYRVVRKGVSRMPSPVFGSPVRTKRVMFEDDYLAFFHDEATKIQKCFRGWWVREGIEVDHYAAGQIQRVFRGWWAREALEVDRYCAVEIQRVIRGYLCRMSYIYDLYCIIVAQSVVRRYLAFYTSAIRLANILYIQAIYRGYRVRSELMSVARRWLTLRKMKKRKLQCGYHHGSRHQQALPYSISKNSSVSRAIHNLQSSSVSRQHVHSHANATSPRWQRCPTSANPSHIQSKGPQTSYSKPGYPISKTTQHPEGFETFHRIGSDEWYDGNKSETSEMLTNWKRRERRSS
eukprot:CCRYP_007206-RA/>CCRYP_007206-RA protein AED:0.05 eAED:0.05 QI:68/1/1/1/0/0/2/344/1097